MPNDKDKVRLLPCPCCGGRAALSTYKKRIGTACRHTVIRQHVVCKVCGTQTRVFKALGRAAAAWHKRQPTQTDALKIAREALEVLSQRLEGIGGCTDGHCLVTGPRKGMHTNGGCSCLRHDKYKAERVVSQYHIFHRAIIAALKESK